MAKEFEDYIKPSLRKNPKHIILHVGTNDLILGRTSQDIATSMVNQACFMKGEKWCQHIEYYSQN